MRVALLLLVVVITALSWWAWSGDAGAVAPGQHQVPAVHPADSTAGHARDTVSSAPPRRQQADVGAADLGSSACGVRGRLLRAGQPVAGAEVLAVERSGSRGDAAVGRSAADGRFLLALAPARYHLEVRGAGVPSGWRIPGIDLSAPRVLDLGDVAVPEPVRVIGRVTDEHGVPLAGARVYVKQGGSFRIDVVDPEAAEADRNVLTDAGGRFAFDGLRAVETSVRAEHAGRQSWGQQTEQFVDGLADVADLVLRPAAALRGLVVDLSGAPIAGATVIPGGGRYDALYRRGAVVSGMDGSFELDAFGRRTTVTVQKSGYAPVALEVDPTAPPVLLRLAAATPFDGRVVGAEGMAGTFTLADPEGVYRYNQLHFEVRRHLYAPQPLAADGSLHLDHLPAGRWVLSARVPGLGTVVPREIEAPLSEPLELHPVPDRRIEVAVTDDRGAPVAGALLARVAADQPGPYGSTTPSARGRTWYGWGARETFATDANGVATLAVPGQSPLALAATAPWHGYTSVFHAAAEVPARVRLVLPRTGRIVGQVADPGLGRHLRWWIRAVAGADDKQGRGSRIDAGGNFLIAGLQPGRYQVLLTLDDASQDSASVRQPPVFEPVPLLSGYDPVFAPSDVEVVAGEAAAVELAAPVLGEVRGRVVAAGVPVAGAIVFGRLLSDRIGDPDELDAYRLKPHMRTGADGCFRFLVATDGEFELRARRPRAPAWSAAWRLQVTPGATVERDLALPAAVIRGRYDMAAIAPADREFFTAQLYPLAKAAADPFATAHDSISLAWEMQRQELGNHGVFGFEGVQPGSWVLRLVNRGNAIVLQQVLQVVADEAHDLGLLERPPQVVPQLRCGLSGGLGVQLRAELEGAPDGVFVAAVARGEQGFVWPALEPGRYRLQAIELFGGWSFGVHGRPQGDPVTVVIHADGATVPAMIWPRGL